MWKHTPATMDSLYQCRAEMRATTSGSSDVAKELPVPCAAPEGSYKEEERLDNMIKNSCWDCKQDANVIYVPTKS